MNQSIDSKLGDLLSLHMQHVYLIRFGDGTKKCPACDIIHPKGKEAK